MLQCVNLTLLLYKWQYRHLFTVTNENIYFFAVNVVMFPLSNNCLLLYSGHKILYDASLFAFVLHTFYLNSSYIHVI